MDDKKKYYEEKAKELLNFNMMAKQSKMSDNLHKMARGEAIMLECLAHSDNGLMPNEIAKSAYVSTARVAAFLKAVEKKGYIQRISLEGDRRKVNIVLTENPDYQVKGAKIVHSLAELQEELKQYRSEDVYVIGGESVYRQLLPYCDVVHATRIDMEYQADAHFPNLEKDPEWIVTADSDEQTYFDIPYTFVKYERSRLTVQK